MPKVCRTCLKEISSSDFITLNDSTVTTSLNSIVVKQELAICIPELDLTLVANPVVCNPCVNDLHAAYDFKRRCLQTEERIHTYVQSNSPETTCVELSQLMGLNLENLVQTDSNHVGASVKTEPEVIEFDSKLSNDNSSFFEQEFVQCKNENLSDNDDNNQQINHLDLPFSNTDNFAFLPELQREELDKKLESLCSKIHQSSPVSASSLKCSYCDYSALQNKDLTQHLLSHPEQAANTPTTSIARRRTLTIEHKVDLIRMLESGTKMAEVCRRTGLATSTVCCIMKNKDAILKAFEKNTPNLKRLRKPTHADVDEALLVWCKEQQSRDASLSGPILRGKAEELARTIGNYNFVCTNGWLDRFKVRYNICREKKGKRKLSCGTDVKNLNE